ncbi:hypothetical protein [uncultured Sphingomonas sp.]|uniref:hypothetical protein n=1 Tax=uncultured Sphingomonas sp. TaxID=158754 RepID=UPI0035CB6BD1
MWRLLIAVLLMLGTSPAVAVPSCHAMNAEATLAGGAGHRMAVPGKMPREAASCHFCIGCIPAGDWTGSRLVTPMPARALAPTRTTAHFVQGRDARPAPPPPRIG